MQRKVGIYCRVSTEEQALVIEGSLDSQKYRLHSFVDIKNMQDSNWGKVIEAYVDEGISAKDTQRPAFQRMLRDVRSGKIDLILVTEFSRLSRSLLDFCTLLEELKKLSAQVLSIKEQFDTSTPIGEMIVLNLMSFNQFERKQTAERVSINFHARALRGLRNGAGIILGYDKDPTNPSRYVINEYEAGQVRRIFEIYRQEASLTKTLRVIESENIQPKTKKEQSHPKIRKWNTAILRRLLRSCAYAGLKEVNAKNKDRESNHLKAYEKYQIVKASWEPIVEPTAFRLVQQMLEENLTRERTRRTKGVFRTYILTGIIYCEECGRPLVGKTGTGRTKSFRYYVHSPRPNQPSTCEIKTIPAEALEEKVMKHMDEVLFREGYLDSIEKRLNFIYNQKSKDGTISFDQCRSDLKQINDEVQRTLSLLTKMADQGVDNLLADALKKLNQQKLAKEVELENLKSKVQRPLNAKADRKMIEVTATEFKRARCKATPTMIKRLLHKVIAGIAISTDKGKIAYWSTEDSNTFAEKTSASDKSSGAGAHNGFSASSGNRKLELVQVFQDVQPLLGEVESDRSAGSQDRKNGWGARIRT